jgi:hypothetical protein
MFNQEANFIKVNGIPVNYTIEETYGGGDCFFDSVARGLKQLKIDMQFTVESLRMVCKDFARDNQDIKKKVIDDARQSPEYVMVPNSDVDDDELWDFYLNNIECTRNSREKIETKDNQDHRYGSTMHLPIWGRPEVEGQMICQKYNIKLHIIEYHPDLKLLHQVIDSSGSQSVEDVDYDEENVVHIINGGNAHFKAIIRQEISRNIDHRSYDSRKIVNSTDSHAFNTEEDNQNYLELIKAREEENETLRRCLEII